MGQTKEAEGNSTTGAPTGMVTRGGELLGEVSPRRGISFGAIHRDVTEFTWFARFLKTGRPDAGDASMITRAVLEGYLAHLGTTGPAPSTEVLKKLPSSGSFEEAPEGREVAEACTRVPPRADSTRRSGSSFECSVQG